MVLTHVFSSYNLRHDDPSVIAIAFHRAVAVTIGVIWAFIVSQFWWPAEARRELGKALGEYVLTSFWITRQHLTLARFCLNVGWLYSRMVMNYATPPEALLRVEPPRSPQVTSEATPLLGQHLPLSHTTLTSRASDQLMSSIHDFLAMCDLRLWL